jgi:hypothetical protein
VIDGVSTVPGDGAIEPAAVICCLERAEHCDLLAAFRPQPD